MQWVGGRRLLGHSRLFDVAEYPSPVSMVFATHSRTKGSIQPATCSYEHFIAYGFGRQPLATMTLSLGMSFYLLLRSHLPRTLANRLVSAGFRFDGASVFPILNLRWDDDAYSKGLAGLIRDFVGRKNEFPPKDLEEWYDEFTWLSEAGRYFFSINRYIFRVSKPGC
jgi:hypothetical protein